MTRTYYHAGDRFSIISINGEPMEYLLAKTSENHVALINMKSGNYWERPKKVKDCGLISQTEMRRISGEHLQEIPFKIERTFINQVSESPAPSLVGKRVELTFLENVPAGKLERVNKNGTYIVSTSIAGEVGPIFYLVSQEHISQDAGVIFVNSYQRSSNRFVSLASI